MDDPEKTITFYRDTLGLELRSDVAYGNGRWMSFGSSDQPELQVTLSTPYSNPSVSPEDQKALADLLAKGVLGFIVFTTDDVDKTFEQIQSSGAEVIQEPMDQQYGVRDCAFRDPSGNIVRFNQPKG